MGWRILRWTKLDRGALVSNNFKYSTESTRTYSNITEYIYTSCTRICRRSHNLLRWFIIFNLPIENYVASSTGQVMTARYRLATPPKTPSSSGSILQVAAQLPLSSCAHCWPPSLLSRTLGHPHCNPFLPWSCCWSQAGRCCWKQANSSLQLLLPSDLTLIKVELTKISGDFWVWLVKERAGRSGCSWWAIHTFKQKQVSCHKTNLALTFTQFLSTVGFGFWVITDFRLVLSGFCRFGRCTRDGVHAFVPFFPTFPTYPFLVMCSVLDFWDLHWAFAM